jgi:hypothetical protein
MMSDEGTSDRIERVGKFDRELAPVMFFASLLALFLIGAFLHLGADDLTTREVKALGWSLAIVYGAFVFEIVSLFRMGGRLTRRHWLVLLIPPFRMATPNHTDGKTLWLPWFGWQTIDKQLRQNVAATFSIPMIALALFVLPLILAEFVWAESIEADRWLRIAFHLATAIIWGAFVCEFTILISLTEKKFTYMLRHWLDVVVICLPMVAFVRSFRLAQLVRLNQVSRSVRLYRMRGVMIRAWRAVVAVDLLDRILIRDPVERIARLEERVREREEEVAVLLGKIAVLRKRIDSESLETSTEHPETLLTPAAIKEATSSANSSTKLMSPRFRPVKLNDADGGEIAARLADTA